MNATRSILSAFFISVLLTACFDSSPKDGPNGIRLDHGSKWRLSDQTITTVNEMHSFFLSTAPLLNEGAVLKKTGSTLRTQMTPLFAGCGVGGAAHDEYHVYLAGLIPAVTTLEKSGRVDDAIRVKYYLDKFGEYFESNRPTNL